RVEGETFDDRRDGFAQVRLEFTPGGPGSRPDLCGSDRGAEDAAGGGARRQRSPSAGREEVSDDSGLAREPGQRGCLQLVHAADQFVLGEGERNPCRAELASNLEDALEHVIQRGRTTAARGAGAARAQPLAETADSLIQLDPED